MVRVQKAFVNASIGVGIIAASACHPTTTVRLNVVNPSTVPVVVDLTSVDDADTPLRSDSRRIAAATIETDSDGRPKLGPDGQPMVKPATTSFEWNGVRRLSRLKLEYHPEASSARFRAGPSIVVPDSGEPFTKEATIGNLHLYDQALSEQSVVQLANDLGGGAIAALSERLVDVLPMLGSAVVATFKFDANGRDSAQVHGSVHLQDIKYEHAPVTQLRSATTADRNLMAKAAAAVPVYGTLATQMDAGDVCHVAWSINHTPVPNNSFDLATALDAASLAQLKSLKNLLMAYPESTIAVIARMHVIESGSFGITKGHAVLEDDRAAFASVYTGSNAYAFALNDESYVSVPSLVVNVWYNKQTDRTSTLSLLDRLIKNRAAAIPPGPSPSLNGLREAVRNGFAPLDLADSSITHEVLKQPMM